jgi:hypothetical protein
MPDPVANDSRSPLEIFGELYATQNGKAMDDEQLRLMTGLIEKIWRDA